MGLYLHFFTFMNLVFVHLLSSQAISEFTSPLKQLCHDDERFALLNFKESLIFDKFASRDPSAYPKTALWNEEEENDDCCLWDGITCREDTGHVIKVDLTSSCLYGSVNSTSSLFHFIHLEWLSLADNNFNGSTIPSEIMNLSKLSHLNLSRSFISGKIPPEIFELSRLVSLDLSNNGYNLELRKPGLESLAKKLTKLKVLDLSEVQISSTVPQVLSNLSSLTFLSLRDCMLQGEFPAEIFRLPNLYRLNIGFNFDLTGFLSGFEQGSLLAYLDLEYCSFSGNIPSSLGNLTNIVHLDLAFNRFSGELPFSIGNLGSLEVLVLTSNQFFGKVPISIGNLCSLRELSLYSCNFSGPVPSSLGNLTQLTSLDLSSNKFSGQVSTSMSWISKLTKLTTLSLIDSNLAGEIPSWLMSLTQLTELHMGHNHLTGPIPSWLMSLNQLSVLQLSFNQLIGPIPSEISKLTQLTIMRLSRNRLQGLIPNSIIELINLEFLDLASNNLNGTVKLEMFLKLPSLKVLIISSNNLSLLTKTNIKTNQQNFTVLGLGSCNLSEFPDFLQSQDQLIELDLSHNKIPGQIPGWFSNISLYALQFLNLSHNLFTGFDHHLVVLPWTDLTTVDLSSNILQGPLPLPPLFTFYYIVSNNNLTGEISTLICRLSNLRILDLSYNNLSGMLPQCLANFSLSLSILRLRSNKFQGSIPGNFMNGTNLRMIDLNNNLLQGGIPKSLVNCTRLEFLDLGNNQITDIFPSWLGTIPELKVLILQSNKFYGVIQEPMTNFEFPKLRIIDLSCNGFHGRLPSKYFQSWEAMKVANASELSYMQDTLYVYSLTGSYDFSLTVNNKGIVMEYGKIPNLLAGITLSSNNFTGEIPPVIADLTGLRFLNLSNNSLLGHIPSSFDKLVKLESLDLSNNMLSGEIPQQLAELTFLAVFNVSYNQLTGAIPRGKQFDTYDNGSFVGNPRLCGQPLSRTCQNSETSTKVDQGFSSSFAFAWWMVMIGYACGLIIGVVLGRIYSKRKHE